MPKRRGTRIVSGIGIESFFIFCSSVLSFINVHFIIQVLLCSFSGSPTHDVNYCGPRFGSSVPGIGVWKTLDVSGQLGDSI